MHLDSDGMDDITEVSTLDMEGNYKKVRNRKSFFVVEQLSSFCSGGLKSKQLSIAEKKFTVLCPVASKHL